MTSLSRAQIEYTVMKKLDHTNIMSPQGYFEDNDNLIIVFELMSQDLRELIVDVGVPFKEYQLK